MSGYIGETADGVSSIEAIEASLPTAPTPAQYLAVLIKDACMRSERFRKELKLKVKTHNKAPPLGWYLAKLERVYGTEFVKQYAKDCGIREELKV